MRSRPVSRVERLGVALGLASASQLVVLVAWPGTAAGPLLMLLAGAALQRVLSRLTAHPRSWPLLPTAAACSTLFLGVVLGERVDPLLPLGLVAGGVTVWALEHGRTWTVRAVATLAPLVVVGGVVAGAGAWSVDEPYGADRTPRAHHGIEVGRDTHAFLIQQGVVILGRDGHRAIAVFLASPDPSAPRTQRPTDGVPAREPYLWRLQLGARDADRVLKAKEMPDHFFNWWTHSGKGLIAGPSAATWAAQQFALAVRLWSQGDRSQAMYRLGAATHLVDDACAPPHATVYVPDHRAYEEWVLAHQSAYAVTSGGVYQKDFRVLTGHGGEEWSSSHTRGWVDECAHRAAELVVNTAQPPPDTAADSAGYVNTMQHFRDTQRLTAGYLTFFFDTVGGP